MSDTPSDIPALAEYDFICATALENFMIAVRPLGEPLICLSQMVQEAFRLTRELMIYGYQHPEPPKEGPRPRIMEQYADSIRRIVDFKNPSKDVKDLDNHISTIKEGISALLFMNVKPAPVPYIKEMIDASQYYGNRVLMTNKGVEKDILFVKKHNELWSDFQQFVKKYFLTGFTWNSLPKAAVGPLGPPPPPPPPMQPLFEKSTGDTGDMARLELLRQLNQGSNITRSLKPVIKGEPAPQVQQGVPTVATGIPATRRQVSKFTVAGGAPAVPPKFALEGKKWKVEFQKANHNIVIESTDMAESVNCYKLEDSSVIVKNKVNCVTVDSCVKLAINIESVISAVELIRCKRVRIKIDGVVPLINLENCEEVQIFLPKKSRDVEIISSKSSASNVCLLEDDGNYVELAMPEQIKTLVSGDQLVNSVVENH